jgi:8-oxo-dGTP pyrophosphatase MutT (NUDIX family)
MSVDGGDIKMANSIQSFVESFAESGRHTHKPLSVDGGDIKLANSMTRVEWDEGSRGTEGIEVGAMGEDGRRIAQGAGETEVLLIRPLGCDRWGLPKGKPNANESLLDTAMRECAEEAGVVLSKGTGTVSRFMNLPTARTQWGTPVTVFASWAIAGDSVQQVPRASKHEVDDVRWQPVARPPPLTSACAIVWAQIARAAHILRPATLAR